VHKGVVYISYSASASWTPNDYTVGVIYNPSGDLLNPAAWVKRGPIFDRHGKTYGPGSIIFAPSPDGSELWALYHAYDRLDCARWACRSIRMQRVSWTADGLPVLGYPLDPKLPHFVPSGDVGLPTGWGDSHDGAAASGHWTSDDRSKVENAREADDRGLHRIFRGDVQQFAYVVSTEIVDDGSSEGKAGVYGIYALYRNEGNYAAALIDLRRRLFIIRAVVGGEARTLQTYPLPAGFSSLEPHTLAAVKTASGGFTFLLDGAVMDRRQLALTSGQVGVLTENLSARFREFRVEDRSHGWGNAFGDAAQGLPKAAAHTSTGDGFVQGAWQIVDANEVRGMGTGAGWHTLYQGSPNFTSYRVEAEVKWTDSGGDSETSAYGLIACHDDRNNQASVWIDLNSRTLRVQARVAGEERNEAVPLPDDFDPGVFHRISAEKRESQFTFSLDDAVLLITRFELVNGTGGVATENVRAMFRGFRFTPLDAMAQPAKGM
jgi:hypothetical protein